MLDDLLAELSTAGKSIDVAFVGADREQSVGDRQSADIAVDRLLPNFLAAGPVKRDQVIHAAGDHQVVGGDQDIIKVAGEFPHDSDFRVLFHLADRFGKFFGFAAKIACLEKPFLFLLARLGMFVSIDAQDLFAVMM